jgi:predicted PurR-regulated permease PerM
METTAKKTIITCSIITVFLLALYLIFLSKTIILYLVIAIILVIAINPLVLRFEKIKIKKVPAVLLSDFLIFLLLVCILGTIIIPLVQQGSNLIQNLPDIVHNILNNPSLITLSQRYHFENNLTQLSSQASVLLLGGGKSIFIITNTIVSELSSLTIVLVLTFLLQIEGAQIWKGLLGFLNNKNSQISQTIAIKASKAVSGFVSGNLFISLIAGTVTFITLMIFNVPYAFALSALVALFDLIPLIGAAIATIVVGLVALTKGAIVALIIVIIILVYQFIESHFIQPIVYSKSISISALIIIIASVLGAEIGGIIGILLAIPMASIVQIIITEIYGFLKHKELA